MNKVTIDQINITQFQYLNKLTRKDMGLMLEAFRRKHLMGKEVGDKFLGLGLPSTYNSKFFTPSQGYAVARVNNWYMLTKAGLALMDKMEAHFVIPADNMEKNHLSQFIFAQGI